MVSQLLRAAAIAALVLLFAAVTSAQTKIEWPGHPSEYLAKVLNGEYRGVTAGTVIGRNDDIDAGVNEDVWNYNGTINLPGTAQVIYVSSDNGADTGMIAVVTGLDGDHVAQTDFCVLAGLTFTPLVGGIDFLRINSVTVSSATAGNVWIHIDSSDGDANGIPDTPATDTLAYIIAGESATAQGFYTCPADRTCWVTDMRLGGGSTTASIGWVLNRQQPTGIWSVARTTTIPAGSGFSSTDVIRLEEQHEMKFRVRSGGANYAFGASATVLEFEN